MHFVYQNMQKYAFSFINTHTNIQGVTERPSKKKNDATYKRITKIVTIICLINNLINILYLCRK